MSRPRLLDLFCGAGGSARGYQLAGFHVTGIDNRPQPRYVGDLFIQADALNPPVRLEDFDVIHASPPCQAYTKARKLQGNTHPDLIATVRNRLDPWVHWPQHQSDWLYVIENVPGAPLVNPVVLEGQMFDGLGTQRARWFETNWPLEVPFLRPPRPAPNAKMGRPPKPHEWMHVVGHVSDVSRARRAMGIDWMSRDELAEAIPPAYTEFIGEQLMEHLERAA